MIVNHYQTLQYLTFETFPNKDIVAACFTRLGGYSLRPYESLNVGSSVGDEQSHVNKNRSRIFEAIGRSPKTLYDAWQIHSTEYVVANAPRDLADKQMKVDILLANNPSITLMMRFADCVPIFLCDHVKKAIGMVHAGWAGTINQIAAKAVEAMQKEFGSSSSNILAGIGPSIGPDHYEVGSEITNQLFQNFPDTARHFITERDGKTYMDLRKINQFVLKDIGVTQIESSEICTACHVDEWFSHRLEKGKTGRFGAVVAIR